MGGESIVNRGRINCPFLGSWSPPVNVFSLHLLSVDNPSSFVVSSSTHCVVTYSVSCNAPFSICLMFDTSENMGIGPCHVSKEQLPLGGGDIIKELCQETFLAIALVERTLKESNMRRTQRHDLITIQQTDFQISLDCLPPNLFV